ncbi:hypothetical protein ALHIDCOG_00434 [Klebsiella phage CPRSB]|nr:hypothetical protein ALHIDCOG_00434 [Klebsiella phage CPRSB]
MRIISCSYIVWNFLVLSGMIVQKNGRTKSGPYVNRYLSMDTAEWLDQFCMNPDIYIDMDDHRHPAPDDDNRLMRNLEKDNIDFQAAGLYFGFQSIQRLSRWFNAYEREYMHNVGFRLHGIRS